MGEGKQTPLGLTKRIRTAQLKLKSARWRNIPHACEMLHRRTAEGTTGAVLRREERSYAKENQVDAIPWSVSDVTTPDRASGACGGIPISQSFD